MQVRSVPWEEAWEMKWVDLCCFILFFLDFKRPHLPSRATGIFLVFLSDLEIWRAVFFIHIPSQHKNWLQCIDWEANCSGRHNLCTDFLLHCVLTTGRWPLRFGIMKQRTAYTLCPALQDQCFQTFFPSTHHPNKTQQTASISASPDLYFLCSFSSILHLAKPSQPRIRASAHPSVLPSPLLCGYWMLLQSELWKLVP